MVLGWFSILYWAAPPSIRKPLKLLYSFLTKLLSPILIQLIDRGIQRIDNIRNAVKFVFSFQYLAFSLKPSQIKQEIVKLLEIVKELEPKLILEIGTAGGGTLFLWFRIAGPEGTVISIDLPGGKFGGGYPKWKMPIFERFAKNSQRIQLLRSDSHSTETFDLVKTALGNRMLDFLFIDGDHRYEGVKIDFEMYFPLVREGGIVAFHDIAEQSPETGGGVNMFWNEIKRNYEHLEIIEDRKQNGYGIGVIYL